MQRSFTYWLALWTHQNNFLEIYWAEARATSRCAAQSFASNQRWILASFYQDGCKYFYELRSLYPDMSGAKGHKVSEAPKFPSRVTHKLIRDNCLFIAKLSRVDQGSLNRQGHRSPMGGQSWSWFLICHARLHNCLMIHSDNNSLDMSWEMITWIIGLLRRENSIRPICFINMH